ncbi:membrane protein [Sphaerisporangium siamense]|uniref:Putative MPP superfamily phosphohydrolase n=1 Tax=Sphaerisporangium siamense TaxID=795645 RepID=A0A7W7GAS0_9ACTN|nr:metallophosphoesterase [Sphaerisporangium siamense]MBB4700286.1 putative MPP superfamily phosphohydrolase [Sphaerisporangium siamense]GII87700.1 membrane protein [Sphaerisporangium siamense]
MGATVSTAVGPAQIGMSLQPSWQGQTVLDVRPLGTLRFDSHHGPIRLRLSLDGIHADVAQQLLESPRWAETLPDLIEADLQAGLRELIIRAAVCAVAGGFLAGLIVFRAWRRALWTSLGSLLAVGLVTAVSAATFNPRSIAEPRYTGLLTGVPSLIGSAESIVTRFSEYRNQLAKLVTNVSQLYHAGTTLPVYSPDPNTLRVLHVSDIHLNPLAWNTIRSLKEQFKINLVVDTGDIADHGTKAENRFVEEIGKLGVPYVYVRGNHDSMGTQRAVAEQKNAVVLDGGVKTVEGLRIYGVGDPRFTPDKSVDVNSDASMLTQLGRAHAQRLTSDTTGRKPSSSKSSRGKAAPTPGATPAADKAAGKAVADLVAVHDPTIGRAFNGAVPLVLAGHVHQRSTEMMSSGTRLIIQGSTGAAGLRGLEHDEPTPIQASVLYFDRTTHRLQAWDDVTLGGLGEQWVQIQRHLEAAPGRTILPEPVPTPSPTGGATATVTPTRR